MNNDNLPEQPTAPSPAAQNGKVFDVVRPGKVPASPTSRPVIVGHAPPVKDDQIIAKTDVGPQLMSHKHPFALQAPTAAPDAQQPIEEAAAPSSLPSPESVAVASTVAMPTDPEPAPASANAPAPLVTADDLKSAGMAEDHLLSETGAPMLDHAIVSHHKRPKRIWQILAILLIILLFAAFIANFLLDAGVIDSNLGIPHTNFISGS